MPENSPAMPSEGELRAAYWPGLDGLRAIAVLLVVGYHADGLLGNGFIGVDLFFVLSGFLITSLLTTEDRRSGGINLAQFYIRRVLRLYPALVVLCVAVVAGAVALHRHVHDVLMGAVATLGYYANVWEYSAGHSTYLLQHTWTLSLEEQFYIVWPVALLLALRFRTAGFVVLGLWVAMEIADKVEPNAVLHTYVRAAGLPIGCLLALVISRERVVRVLRPLGVPCLAAIVVLACLPGDLDGIFSGWPASLAAILTVPVVVLLVGRNRVSHVLSAAPLVWIGRRSYSLYLWHFPIFTIAINQAPKTVPVPIRLLVALIGAFIAAAASYRFVEMPFLRLKKRFEPSTRSPAPEFVASHRSKP